MHLAQQTVVVRGQMQRGVERIRKGKIHMRMLVLQSMEDLMVGHKLLQMGMSIGWKGRFRNGLSLWRIVCYSKHLI
jgi:hypothetical protein